MDELLNSPELSDEALLAGMATGDEAASVAFVRRFQRRVYGLASRILGDPTSAEDVAQEALVRAWKHAQAYDPRRGSVATWLLTITRNLAIDQLRLKRADAVDPKDIVESWPPRFAPGPDELAVGADEARRLGVVLAGLPLEQRRALVLAAFGGRTAAEIGHIEDIPLGTAKTRIRTALIKVRTSMVSTATPDQDAPW